MVLPQPRHYSLLSSHKTWAACLSQARPSISSFSLINPGLVLSHDRFRSSPVSSEALHWVGTQRPPAADRGEVDPIQRRYLLPRLPHRALTRGWPPFSRYMRTS